jgi:hypothetical protein
MDVALQDAGNSQVCDIKRTREATTTNNEQQQQQTTTPERVHTGEYR